MINKVWTQIRYKARSSQSCSQTATDWSCDAVQKEASEVFFSVTKLYQSKDANLRRMVYLVIKDVCPGSDEVIIITSSLMKDMNSKTDLYRSNAIRVLCSITDSQLLGQIERYLKQVRMPQRGHRRSR